MHAHCPTLALTLIAGLACSGEQPPADGTVPPATESLGPSAALGFTTDNMDVAADPGADFYRYAAGAWLDRTEIPPTEDRVVGAGGADVPRVYQRGSGEFEARRGCTSRPIPG